MKNSRISEKILFGAFAILLEWERTNANLDECIDRLREEENGGQPAIASLLFEYFRHKDFIDGLIQSRARKGGVKQELRILIACALTQAIFQTGIAAESAVNVAVDCIKKKCGRGPSAFANAVMRSALASDEAKNPPPHSFPKNLENHWNKIFGMEKTAEILQYYAANPAPVFRARKEIPENPSLYRLLPELDFTSPFQFYEILDPDGFFHSGMIEHGQVYVQDPATMLALSLLKEPVAGRLLDACAAPGGKSILLGDLAARQGNGIELIAADRSPQRLRTLQLNLKRARIQAETVVASARDNPFAANSFDLILADVPCGNSGVIRRRCDAPWRFTTKKIADVASLQEDILEALSCLVKPGGSLLYSTCSIEPQEDEWQVKSFLEHHPEFKLADQKKLFPSKIHDGAFGALLKKENNV